MHTARTAWGESLVCEYLRLLLIGSGACNALYWTGRFLAESLTNFAEQNSQSTSDSPFEAFGLLMTGLFVAGSASLTAGNKSRLVSITITTVAFAFLFVLISREYTQAASLEHFAPFSPIASIAYVTGLLLLTVMQLDQPAEDSFEQPHDAEDTGSHPPHSNVEDTSELVLQPEGRSVARLAKWFIGGVLTLLLFYMVVWPAAQWALGWGEFDVPTTVGDQLTLGQEIRVRSAKLAVFLIFVAFGASFGSFLHVVAYTLPRGQGIPLRSSACPVCTARIRLRDNIPIFSYLLLKGRCRDCGTEIPIRYLWAEILMASMFASFFLLELVIGAKNLPGFREVYYTGIVWVILYTKWDIVGIVAYHLIIYMAILTTMYANWQKRYMPWYFWVGMFLAIGALPQLFHFLLPVKFAWSKDLTQPLSNGLTSLVGGLAGIGIGAALTRFFSWHAPLLKQSYEESAGDPIDESFGDSLREILPTMTMLGLGLGWQAVLGTMAVFCVLLAGLHCARLGRSWLGRNGLLPVLLLAGLIHLFAWKSLARLAQPVWPHQNSSWLAIVGFTGAVLAGLFLISRGWKSQFIRNRAGLEANHV